MRFSDPTFFRGRSAEFTWSVREKSWKLFFSDRFDARSRLGLFFLLGQEVVVSQNI